MGLTIQGNTVSAQGKVTVSGNECNTVNMYGYEVWKKQTNEWETLFSGSQSFTATGSMTVSGLKSGDTVTVSATAEFAEYSDYGDYEYTDSMTRQQLPASLSMYSMASIDLSVGINKIDFVFNEYTESYKGELMEYIPTKLTITEIRRKI